MSPPRARASDSLDTLLDQATAFLEDGDHRRAVMCYRRAQRVAPFRSDIRAMMAEAIDGLLTSPDVQLSGDFSAEDFTKTRRSARRRSPSRRRTRRLSWRHLFNLLLLVGGLVVAVILAVVLRGMVGGGEREGAFMVGEGTARSSGEPIPSEQLIEEARAALAISQFEDALALLDEAMATEGGKPEEIQALYSEVHLMRGREHFNRGRYRRALRDCLSASEYNPQSAEALYSIAYCHFYLGRDERNAGSEDAALQHYRDSRDAFRASISLDESLAKSHRGLGMPLYQLGDRAGAFEAWRRTIEVAPDSTSAQRARELLQSHGMSVPDV